MNTNALKKCLKKGMKMVEKLRKQWKIITAKKMVDSIDNPEIVYRLSSGYTDREIEVFEDAYETLSVKHVYKKG